MGAADQAHGRLQPDEAVDDAGQVIEPSVSVPIAAARQLGRHRRAAAGAGAAGVAVESRRGCASARRPRSSRWSSASSGCWPIPTGWSCRGSPRRPARRRAIERRIAAGGVVAAAPGAGGGRPSRAVSMLSFTSTVTALQRQILCGGDLGVERGPVLDRDHRVELRARHRRARRSSASWSRAISSSTAAALAAGTFCAARRRREGRAGRAARRRQKASGHAGPCATAARRAQTA